MISVKEMYALEEYAVSKGVSKTKLMDNAGKEACKIIKQRYPLDKHIVIVCYHGNNGGDGFALARYLDLQNFEVSVIFIGDQSKLKKEAQYHFLQLQETDVPLYQHIMELAKADVVVDAMLGMGIKGSVQGIVKDAILAINALHKPVVSLDMPSGSNDCHINAELVIAFHDKKPMEYHGELKIVDIGIPD